MFFSFIVCDLTICSSLAVSYDQETGKVNGYEEKVKSDDVDVDSIFNEYIQQEKGGSHHLTTAVSNIYLYIYLFVSCLYLMCVHCNPLHRMEARNQRRNSNKNQLE